MSSSSSGSTPWDMDSYDGKLMFAAIISLLLVLSFVLLLHAYARWVFLLDQSALHRRRTTLTLSTTATTTTRRLHHHLNVDEDEDEMCGLDASVVASIPTFVHREEDKERYRLECVICLSVFENGDIGRHLPNCDHAFHVQCIDKWLRSHSSCPICRALVGCNKVIDVKLSAADEDDGVAMQSSSETLDVVVDQEPSLQVEIDVPPVESDDVVHRCLHPPPPPPPPPLPADPVVYAIKRMFSMRGAEHKVFPASSNVNV